MFELDRLPPRDVDGYTMHPDMPLPVDEESWEAMAKACWALGWKVDYVLYDEIVDADAEGCDVPTWQPEPPDGDGWILVAIYDTEDGPAAMFVRPNDGAKATAERSEDGRA